MTAATIGEDLDADGYTVRLDGSDARALDPDGSVTYDEVEEGQHDVALSGVQANCTVEGGTSRSVSVEAEETTTVAYEVTCEASSVGRMVYESHQGADVDLWSVRPDGTNPERLTSTAEDDEAPDVSPDGTRVVFGREVAPGDGDLLLLELSDGSVDALTTGEADDFFPSWSPDGERVVFARSTAPEAPPDLYLVNADGSGLARLTSDPATDTRPSWCGDGSRIVFESRRDGNREIYSIRPDGTELTRLTDDPAADADPACGPDGQQIAFLSGRAPGGLFLMDVDGSDVTSLTSGDQPDWSPDGRSLAFTDLDEGPDDDREIFRVETDGTGREQLTDTEASEQNPSWGAATD